MRRKGREQTRAQRRRMAEEGVVSAEEGMGAWQMAPGPPGTPWHKDDAIGELARRRKGKKPLQ